MKRILIVGLGNIGSKYEETRHNIGFKILEGLAQKKKIDFSPEKFGFVTSFNEQGIVFILLKPSTYMNLSGKALSYWKNKESICLENILVVLDDLNIDFGIFKLKRCGSDGGHNGLKDIDEKLSTNNYARFRFGIGDSFEKSKQAEYVLSEWNKDEKNKISQLIEKSSELIVSFGIDGISKAMNSFNGKQIG